MAAVAEEKRPSLPVAIATRAGNIIDKVSLISGQISGVLMLISCLCIFYGIITRAFNNPSPWVYEVTIYMMMWFVSLALSFTQQQKANIEMDIFVSRISEKKQEVLMAAVYIMSQSTCANLP